MTPPFRRSVERRKPRLPKPNGQPGPLEAACFLALSYLPRLLSTNQYFFCRSMKEKLYDIPMDHPSAAADFSRRERSAFVNVLRGCFVRMFQQLYAQGGPPGLVARAQPSARIPMEIFVKQD